MITFKVTQQISQNFLLYAALSLLHLSFVRSTDKFCNNTEILQAEEGMFSNPLIECNVGYFQTPCFQHRSKASGKLKLTVYFTDIGQYISYKITSPASQCEFRITDVVYSKDEDGPDNITVLLDNEVVGGFTTHDDSGNGNLWNVFNSSGPIGNARTIYPRVHWLKIKISEMDKKGVELDKVEVSFYNCHGQCPKVSAAHPAISDNGSDDDDGWSDELIIGIAYGLVIIVLLVIATILTCVVCVIKVRR